MCPSTLFVFVCIAPLLYLSVSNKPKQYGTVPWLPLPWRPFIGMAGLGVASCPWWRFGPDRHTERGCHAIKPTASSAE